MEEKTDWKKDKLKGAVRNVHTDKAALENDGNEWIEGARIPVETVVYSSQGKRSKEAIYSEDGQMSEVTFIKESSDGRKIEHQTKRPNGGYVALDTFIYDEYGREIERIRTLNRGLITKYRRTFVYDNDGRLAEQVFYNDNGSISDRATYSYRDDGSLSEMILYCYSDDGSLEEKWVSIYEKNGNVIEWAGFRGDGQPLGDGKYIYEYDNDGNEIRCDCLNEWTNKLSSQIFYEYEFDEVGNWVKRVRQFAFVNSDYESREVTYRTIKYF